MNTKMTWRRAWAAVVVAVVISVGFSATAQAERVNRDVRGGWRQQALPPRYVPPDDRYARPDARYYLPSYRLYMPRYGYWYGSSGHRDLSRGYDYYRYPAMGRGWQ
jgi:hypothetical protein